MNRHSFRPLLAALLLSACSVTGPADSGDGSDDVDDAIAEDVDAIDGGGADGDGKADDPSWRGTATLHQGDRSWDHADAGGRQVHGLWAAGTPDAPVPLTITVESADETPVRVAVLGPLDAAGKRTTIAAAGYSSRSTVVEVDASLTETGKHLVVVGSYGLESDVTYEVEARCAPTAGDLCTPERVDLLASPKVGALAGGVDADPADLVRASLGAVMDARDFDLEVEVWASPPGLPWDRTLVATSVASGNQVNAIVPASVQAGDDLTLVVREAGGEVLDSGVVTRYAPAGQAFARLDAILYGDLVAVTVAGVTGYTEGVAELALRSVTHDRQIERVVLHSDHPGQVGMGFAAFDATFAPELTLPGSEELNPVLPRNGELLSVGWIGGNGGFNRLGCFEYCNDLSGEDACTGGPRACP
jgi:hypothetical protein